MPHKIYKHWRQTMAVAFAKTAKGHDEISTKAGGLTPRQRRVLIMIDGKRTVDDLRSMLQADDLQHTLGLLEEDGYIEVAGDTVQAGTSPAPLPSITAFAELPATPDPVRM